MLILPEAIQTMFNAFMAVFAKKEDIPIKVSDLDNDSGYITEKNIETVPDDDFLGWLNEEKIVEPVASATGEIYTTNNNEIYIL